MRAAAFLLAACLLGPAAASGQDNKPDSTPNTVAAEAKTKGGLFGKAKKLAKNKVVKTIAKTAVCTMVPGGQAIAGAIDAAGADNTGEAAQGAAAAASGSTCMPGMGVGGMPGAGMTGGLGGVGAAASMAGAMPGLMGGGVDQDPGAAMGYGAMPGSMPGMIDEATVAGCMGLSIEEYRAFNNPTGWESRQPTKEEMKRQQQLAKKVDRNRYAACMTQQLSAVRAVPAAPKQAGATEATVASVEISADLLGELRKGKTALRRLGWTPGSAELQLEARAPFSDAMAKLAAALRQAGASYRADLYIEATADKATAERIGAARLVAVHEALGRAGTSADLLVAGKVKVHKDPRLELVRIKK